MLNGASAGHHDPTAPVLRDLLDDSGFAAIGPMALVTLPAVPPWLEAECFRQARRGDGE